MTPAALAFCALALAATPSAPADIVEPGAMGSGQYTIIAFPGHRAQHAYYAQGTATPGVLGRRDSDGHIDAFGNLASASSGYDSSFFDEATSSPAAPVIRLSGFATTDLRSTTLDRLFKTTASAFGVILFSVDEPVAFNLTGSLTIDHLSAAGPGSISTLVGARLSPYNPFADSLVDRAIGKLSGPGTLDLDQSGILEPGAYFLQAYTYTETTAADTGATYSAKLTYDARIQFTPIPAPGALTALALGVIAGTFRRRR